MYADYTFYTEVYKGTAISKTDFDRLGMRGSEYVDYITINRAASAAGPFLEAVKKAACAVAEVMQAQERLMRDDSGKPVPGPIRNEKVGGHSTDYAVAAAGRTESLVTQRAELYRAASRYLAHTGLLYGGVVVI